MEKTDFSKLAPQPEPAPEHPLSCKRCRFSVPLPNGARACHWGPPPVSFIPVQAQRDPRTGFSSQAGTAATTNIRFVPDGYWCYQFEPMTGVEYGPAAVSQG